jgi:hypothetical protein
MSTTDETPPEQFSFLHIRPTKAQKARWVKAASASPHRKLERWVCEALDRAAQADLDGMPQPPGGGLGDVQS